MKKNLIMLVLILLLCGALYLFTDIQSKEEYYLIHLEDITEDSETVTLTINCETVLDHMDDLDESLKKGAYLPEDGQILIKTAYVLRPGDTAFDILSRAVRANQIQMEYQGSSGNLYSSVYIRGISYLYEFSCGPLSGWMYEVNGEIPGVGCDSYALSDGDDIAFLYTCDLGEDLKQDR